MFNPNKKFEQYLDFARDNFENTTDAHARCRFYSTPMRDEYNWEYREDTAVFGKITIRRNVKEMKVVYTIEGLNNDRKEQCSEIEAVIMTYMSCKPGFPASDRRSQR